MGKSKVTPVISLIVISLITMFLWLGKTPISALEANKPYLPSPQIEQPVDPKPVESPDDANALDEADDPNDSAYTEEPDESPETVVVKPENLTDVYQLTSGLFELPVEGATGWAAIAMPVYSDANTNSKIITEFGDGQVFLILEESGDWWKVKSSDGETGWVEHKGCLINLPDIMPSIVYNITNAYSALTRSSGYEIPGVTGHKLYDAFAYNPRLLRYEFIVPSLYSSSKLLCAAQQLALECGDTIVMYEAYRAHVSQQRTVTKLKELMETNQEVSDAINTEPWSLNWFIAVKMSNHQRGVAFDVSLGKVLSYDIMQIGNVFIPRITTYDEYAMPTTIHELSPRSATLSKTVPTSSRDAWRDVPLADTMTPGAILLQSYFDEAGFTPMSSEWWHFNDLDSMDVAVELDISGSFFVGGILSVLP